MTGADDGMLDYGRYMTCAVPFFDSAAAAASRLTRFNAVKNKTITSSPLPQPRLSLAAMDVDEPTGLVYPRIHGYRIGEEIGGGGFSK